MAPAKELAQAQAGIDGPQLKGIDGHRPKGLITCVVKVAWQSILVPARASQYRFQGQGQSILLPGQPFSQGQSILVWPAF